MLLINNSKLYLLVFAGANGPGVDVRWLTGATVRRRNNQIAVSCHILDVATDGRAIWKRACKCHAATAHHRNSKYHETQAAVRKHVRSVAAAVVMIIVPL